MFPLPSVFSYPLCKFALSSRPPWKAFAPLRSGAGGRRVYTYFMLGGTSGLEGNILFSFRKAREIEESRGGIFFNARTVIILDGDILTKRKNIIINSFKILENIIRKYILSMLEMILIETR